MFFLNLSKTENAVYKELNSKEVNIENSTKVVSFLASRIKKENIYFLGRNNLEWAFDGFMFMSFLTLLGSAFYIDGVYAFILILIAVFAPKTFTSFFHFLFKPNKHIQFWVKNELQQKFNADYEIIKKELENTSDKVEFSNNQSSSVKQYLESVVQQNDYKKTLDAKIDQYVGGKQSPIGLNDAKQSNISAAMYGSMKKDTLYRRGGIKIVE